MKKLLTLGTAAVVMASFLLYGCKKKTDELVSAESEQQAAVDNEMAESAARDAGNMSAAAYKAKSTGKPEFRVYDTFGDGFAVGVKIDTTIENGQIVLTCDFGEQTPCGDGVTRKGKIIARWNVGEDYEFAAKRVTFDSYHFRNRSIKGEIYITSISLAGGGTSDNYSITDLVLKEGNDSTLINGGLFQDQIEGKTTDAILDDVYSIRGGVGGSGWNSEKQTAFTYSTSILAGYPIIKAMDCKYPKSGKVSFTVSGKKGRTLDFGSKDTCDNKATLTIGTNTFPVTFK